MKTRHENSGTTHSCIPLLFILLLLTLSTGLSAQSSEKKVYMHYMGWYGPGQYGRHWIDGVPDIPQAGYYDSRDWSTQLYHILLSWSAGIDGLIINVNDSYDETSMKNLIQTFGRLRDINEDFSYTFSVSYDDQGMNNQTTAESKLAELRDLILPNTDNYQYRSDRPVIWIWNYGDYLTASEYQSAINNVFTESDPVILWNEIDASAELFASSFYPWVQGFSSDGSNWGESYLNWYYSTIQGKSTLDFATGAVWPGFDERSCSWGVQERWIDRQNGYVYNQTWNKIDLYNGTLPLEWVLVETWNDWNEGTVIEPGIGLGIEYLLKTAEWCGIFKDSEYLIDATTVLAARDIYIAALMIQDEEVDSAQYYPVLCRAISGFLARDWAGAISRADEITGGILGFNKNTELADDMIIMHPPESKTVQIDVYSSGIREATVEIYDLNGKLTKQIYQGKLTEGRNSFTADNSALSNGIYLCMLKTVNGTIVKKFVNY